MAEVMRAVPARRTGAGAGAAKQNVQQDLGQDLGPDSEQDAERDTKKKPRRKAEQKRCGCPASTSDHALGGAEERFRGLLEAAPDAMVIVDDTGIIRLVNAQTEALFGYDREELLGRPVEMLVPDRFRDQHTAHRAGTRPTGRCARWAPAWNCTGCARTAPSSPSRSASARWRPPTGCSCPPPSATSATARPPRRASTSWPRSWSRSQDAILAKTLDGDITYWNAAAERLYGYTAEEADRPARLAAGPARSRGPRSASCSSGCGDGEKVEHYETLRLTRSGALLDVDVTLWPSPRDPRRHGRRRCAIVRDITRAQAGRGRAQPSSTSSSGTSP